MSSRPSIVAGFDPSPSGYDAVALARQLATAADARLIVAHVYLEAVSAIEVTPPPELLAQRRQEAVARVERAHVVLEGFEPWEPVVYAAEPAARGLHEVAERTGAELIVVGSTHRHGAGRVIPGATAERLLHGSACPIAIAPAGWRGDAIETIGTGFDGSAESQAALAAAATLARVAGASLRVLGVFEPPDPANPIFALTSHGYGEITGDLRAAQQARLDQAVEALPSGLHVRGQLIDGHPAEVLAAESDRLDLLVIGSRGYGALRATLVGSVAHRLAGSARCPLLLVPRGVEQPLYGLGRRTSRHRSAEPPAGLTLREHG
jgi:nucleotide-binding universal stress UspA family protein